MPDTAAPTALTWVISTLERSLPDGLVLTAHWRLTGIAGNSAGSVYGAQAFPAKDPADPSFTPYESLTQAQVLGWVQEAMGADTVAAHEAHVQAQIDAQRNPVTATGLPWAASA